MSSGLYSGQPGLSLGTGLYRNVSGLWSGASGLAMAFGGAGMTLSLNFLTTTSLDRRVTFSRGTQAMLTDSTGKLTYAPNNLTTFSEQFDNAAWTKTFSSVVANVATAPDGTSTADKLVEDTTNNGHNILAPGAVVVGNTYVHSVYLKAAGRNIVEFYGSGFAAQGFFAKFNLSNGTMFTNTGSRGAIQSVGNGWYRCSIWLVASGTSALTIAMCDSSGNNVYIGDGTSGVFMWGAQTEQVTYQTTPSTYNSTTPKNLAPFTQEFDNAAWTKTSVTVTANIAAAPDGTLSADKLIGTAVATGHFISGVGIAASAPLGTPYAGSVYVKESGYGFAFIGLNGTGYPSAPYISVNLATGATAVTNGAPTSYAATSVGNGWWRVSIIGTTAASGSVQLDIRPSPDGVWANRNLAQNGTDGILIWGAQLSDSASLDPYVYNPGAAPTSSAYQGPRFDYDPVTLAPRGLLIEEQRTNLLVRSEEFDNAIWTKAGVTVTANATTSPDGTVDADTVVEGTSSGQHSVDQYVALSASTTYAITFYAKRASGTRDAFIQVNTSGGTTGAGFAWFNLGTGVASAISTLTGTFVGISASATDVGNGWYRCTLVFTSNAGNTGAVIFFGAYNANRIYTGDGTSGIYIWGAQLEAGAFATSYMPTVASQVTRTADVATITGTNFSQWYNQSEGTFVAGFSQLYSQQLVGTQGGIVRADDGTNNNQISIVKQSNTNQIWGTITSGGANGLNGNTGRHNANETKTAALAYKSGDSAGVLSGGTPLTSASANVPTALDRLRIGSSSISAGAWMLNGHIRSITYYPIRLSNAQLQALTS